MKCFKVFPCNNIHSLQQQVLTLFPMNKLNASSVFYIDNSLELFMGITEIKNFLMKNNLINFVRSFAFCVVPGKTEQSIHVDTGESQFGLNFPILNYKGSTVNFYETESDPIEKKYYMFNKEITYKEFIKTNCRKIDYIDLKDEPYLMNIHTPHNVINDNVGSRVTLLTRFYRTFDETCPLQ